MILRHIKISELEAFCSESQFVSWKNLPITPARAKSQALNPEALPDDTALIIAVDEAKGDLLAFAGALPARMNSAGDKRFAWNSCWWTGGDTGAEASMKVFVSFLKIWEQQVAFSDMTEKTFRIISNMGFCHCMERDGYLLGLRPGMFNRTRNALLKKKQNTILPALLHYSGFTVLAEVFSFLVYNFPQNTLASFTEVAKPVRLNFPGREELEFMKSSGTKNIMIPGEEDLHMPLWLIHPSEVTAPLYQRYYFSSFAYDLSVFWLRWKSENGIEALVMLSLRDGILKTLYVYCSENFQNEFPGSFIHYCLSNNRIDSIVTAQPLITEYIANNRIYMAYRRKFKRYSAVSNKLMKYFDGEPVLQDGDGDYRFT